MNFDAITLIENARLEIPFGSIIGGALVVEINGNEGYTCGIVDQHTADLLCQKVAADHSVGAINVYTQRKRFKTNNMNFKIYESAANVL